MKTLHLNLKKEWFKMILSGEKKEEYRDISEHWVSQLFERTEKPLEKFPNKSARSTFNFLSGFCGSRMTAVIYGLETGVLAPKIFDTITFSNGYAVNRPQFEIEITGFLMSRGKPEWGAEPKKNYFVLELGEILNDVNCAKIILEASSK